MNQRQRTARRLYRMITSDEPVGTMFRFPSEALMLLAFELYHTCRDRHRDPWLSNSEQRNHMLVMHYLRSHPHVLERLGEE